MKNGDAGIFPVYYSLKILLTQETNKIRKNFVAHINRVSSLSGGIECSTLRKTQDNSKLHS